MKLDEDVIMEFFLEYMTNAVSTISLMNYPFFPLQEWAHKIELTHYCTTIIYLYTGVVKSSIHELYCS